MAESKGLVLGLNPDATRTKIDNEIPEIIKKVNADIANNPKAQLIVGLNGTETGKKITKQITEIVKNINQTIRNSDKFGLVVGLDEKETLERIRVGIVGTLEQISQSEASRIKIDVNGEDISSEITTAINNGFENANTQINVTPRSGNTPQGATTGQNGNSGNPSERRGNQVLNPPPNARNMYDDPEQVKKLAQLQSRTASLYDRITPSFKNSTNTLMSDFDSFRRTLSSPEAINNVQALETEFSALSARITDAGALAKSFGDKLKTSLSSSVFAGMAKMMVTTAVLGNFSTMYENVKKIDKQFTELRKVSSASLGELMSYMDRASVKAGVLGVNISELVSATADFARLGYQLKDAELLGETATKFYQVGDDFEDISQSTQVIVSALAAQFKNLESLDVSKGAQTLVDEMNEVSNNYSISAGGLAEAMTRSAASLAQAGATSSQAWGIITGSNAVVQDPDSVGRHFADVKNSYIGQKPEVVKTEERLCKYMACA